MSITSANDIPIYYSKSEILFDQRESGNRYLTKNINDSLLNDVIIDSTVSPKLEFHRVFFRPGTSVGLDHQRTSLTLSLQSIRPWMGTGSSPTTPSILLAVDVNLCSNQGIQSLRQIGQALPRSTFLHQNHQLDRPMLLPGSIVPQSQRE